MCSSNSIPNRVLIVDKRLVHANLEQFHFIQLTHPRTKQEQSYTVDQQSKTVFELIQCTRSHSSWFINDQYVLPDGSLYIATPINLIFLLLPSVWSLARTKFVPLKTLMDNSLKQLQLDDAFIIEKLSSVCDIDHEKQSIKLNEENLMKWFRNRIDLLKQHVKDEENAFDLLCEYLPDDIVEKCQEELKVHGNVRYDVPVGQKERSVVATVASKKTLETKVTTTTKTTTTTSITKSKRAKK